MIPNTLTEAVLSNADTLMSVQGISKALDDQRVLADISFDVFSGEIRCRRSPMAGRAVVALPAQAAAVLCAGSYLALP